MQILYTQYKLVKCIAEGLEESRKESILAGVPTFLFPASLAMYLGSTWAPSGLHLGSTWVPSWQDNARTQAHMSERNQNRFSPGLTAFNSTSQRPHAKARPSQHSWLLDLSPHLRTIPRRQYPEQLHHVVHWFRRRYSVLALRLRLR